MSERDTEIRDLVGHLRSSLLLFTDSTSGEPYAELSPVAGGDVLRLRSEAFHAWVDRASYERLSALFSGGVRRQVLALLEAAARYEGPRRPVHVRLAGQDRAVVVDLGGPGRHAVRASADGWEIIERPPVAFFTHLAEREGPRPVGWPKAPNRLTGHLRIAAPLLRAHGVELGAERTATRRVMVVTRRRTDDGPGRSRVIAGVHATAGKDSTMTVVAGCDASWDRAGDGASAGGADHA